MSGLDDLAKTLGIHHQDGSPRDRVRGPRWLPSRLEGDREQSPELVGVGAGGNGDVGRHGC